MERLIDSPMPIPVVMISVSDTGSGLPAQHAHIFNAFFTTKPHVMFSAMTEGITAVCPGRPRQTAR